MAAGNQGGGECSMTHACEDRGLDWGQGGVGCREQGGLATYLRGKQIGLKDGCRCGSHLREPGGRID